jgi:hypothetical protein
VFQAIDFSVPPSGARVPPSASVQYLAPPIELRSPAASSSAPSTERTDCKFQAAETPMLVIVFHP